MKKNPYPLYEPLPYYMSAIGMQGARFIEGTPDPVAPVAPVTPTTPAAPVAPVPPAPADPPKPPAEDLSAKLAAADQRAKEAEEKLQKIEDAKLSDIDRITKERDTIAASDAAKDLQIARLTALATHPVSTESKDMVTGTDAASFLASAKRISELEAKAAGKPGVVHQSGTGEGGAPAGGSLATGRELYQSRFPKKNS